MEERGHPEFKVETLQDFRISTSDLSDMMLLRSHVIASIFGM
jgi:hypothetical protein